MGSICGSASCWTPAAKLGLGRTEAEHGLASAAAGALGYGTATDGRSSKRPALHSYPGSLVGGILCVYSEGASGGLVAAGDVWRDVLAARHASTWTGRAYLAYGTGTSGGFC